MQQPAISVLIVIFRRVARRRYDSYALRVICTIQVYALAKSGEKTDGLPKYVDHAIIAAYFMRNRRPL